MTCQHCHKDEAVTSVTIDAGFDWDSREKRLYEMVRVCYPCGRAIIESAGRWAQRHGWGL